jgi:hypothetical protein
MIGLGFPTATLATAYSTFIPVKIAINEDFNQGYIDRPFGCNRYFHRPANANITLDFDVFDEADLVSLRTKLMDRFYEKKFYLHQPNLEDPTATLLSTQVYDYNVHTGYQKAYTVRQSSWPTAPTELSSANYTSLQNIDTNPLEIVSAAAIEMWLWVQMDFDVSAFITAQTAPAIERLCLFMHNPYCVVNSLPDGYKVFAYNVTRAKWMQIGEQGFSLSDADLRTISRVNQQYFSIKKNSNFGCIADYIDGNNKVSFAMCNVNKAINLEVKLGMNYAGLLVNGYPVQLVGDDAFTYRELVTGAGFTGSLALQEI